MITQINIVKEPEYYYPAAILDSGKSGLMTYEESSKLSDLPNASNIVQKSQTAGLLRNNGTVDTNGYVKESDIELEKTATGNPITLTDAVSGNALEVSAEIVASQDLHGYDKPWVGGAGANMLHLLTPTTGWEDTVNGVVVVTPSSGNVNKDLFYDTLELGKYTVKDFTGGSNTTHQIALFKNDNVLAYITDGSQTFTVTSTSDTYRIRVYVYSGNTDTIIKPICCKGESISAYSPYANICTISGFSTVTITDVDSESHTATVTVALGQTVYGGTLNLTTGELTITHANIASYNGETIGEPWISSMDEYTQGGTPTTGAQVVYTLATPTTTTLTAAQLALVKGYNHLTCNSGDMEITYKASGLDALKERVDELEDAVADLETDMASKAENSVVGTVESGTTASQPYAVGEHFIRNDAFCTCISAIASGATLTLNTNYVEGTIAEAISNCVRYVDSAKIELGNLSWITTVTGMKYADASSYVTLPSNAKIVSAVLFDWGNCPSDLIIQPYISSDSKFRLMSNKSSGSYVYYRVFYIV